MLDVQPYDLSLVPEPTEEDLAEVDAALAAAPSVDDCAPFDAWVNSYPVKAVLSEIGLPDGSATWILDFTAKLLATTDALGAVKERYQEHRLVELASRWRSLDASSVGIGSGPAQRVRHEQRRILREMNEILPIPAIARYLGEPEYLIERRMFNAANLATLRRAARLHVDHGLKQETAAQLAGVARETLRRFIKAWQLPVPMTTTTDGRKQMPTAVLARVKELADQGVKPKAAHAQVCAEFPRVAETLGYDAVRMVMARRRAA